MPTFSKCSDQVKSYAAQRNLSTVEACADLLVQELQDTQKTALYLAVAAAGFFLAGVLTAVWLW